MSTAIAVAALVRDGRVLMVHRHPDRRWYPDCWDLVGGHIEPGESPERAVIRECLDEVNIRVVELRPMPMTITDSALEIHAFVVDRWDGEPVNAAPDEHDGLGWFGPTELERLTLAHPSSRQDILSVTGDRTIGGWRSTDLARRFTSEPG